MNLLSHSIPLADAGEAGVRTRLFCAHEGDGAARLPSVLEDWRTGCVANLSCKEFLPYSQGLSRRYPW